MKSLQQGKLIELMEQLTEEMAKKGVALDNVSYSTIITRVKRCDLYDKAVEGFCYQH